MFLNYSMFVTIYIGIIHTKFDCHIKKTHGLGIMKGTL